MRAQDEFDTGTTGFMQQAANKSARRPGRFRVALLGGVVGDALGAPVGVGEAGRDSASLRPEGTTQYAPAYGGLGTITDDTQMTLFTAEG